MSQINWIPTHQHSSFGSLLDGASTPEKQVETCKELGYKSCAITEHGNMLSAVKLEKACKKHGLKPIFGNEFYFADSLDKTPENRKNSHLVISSTSLDGWKNLVKLNNEANKNFYYKPRIHWDLLEKYSKDLICISGHPGSQIANELFIDLNFAYGAPDYETCKTYIKSDWVKRVSELAGRFKDILGDRFFLEIQLFDQDNMPAQQVIAKALRFIGKKLGIPCVATADSHYAKKEDARDQRALLCISLQTTLKQVQSKLSSGEEFGLDGFFKSSQYYIPSLEEMIGWHEPDELKNSLVIDGMCQSYSILNKPSLPSFENSVQRLREECREGWKQKIGPYISDHNDYVERVERELKVIEDASLSDYFLIVQDFVKWANNHGILSGPGRGSAAGSLVSYLTGITQVNPIEHGLIFERFYNSGRNTKDSVSYPDIDIDLMAERRDEVVQYIRGKYTDQKVAQICTVGRMMGRGIIKDLCRIYDVPYDEVNRITDFIPDEAKIADQLQHMSDAGEKPSIVLWALQNHPEELKQWAELENGHITGKYGHIFAQAIRLEGTARSTGKHASGLVISPETLEDFCPMLHDKKSDNLICGLELEDLEPYGIVKFDLLGLKTLSCVNTTLELING